MFRSLLFVPGNNESRMKKAMELAADAVIFDLEDAVAVSEKDHARELVCHMLEQEKSKKIFVRINSLGTKYADSDLKAIVPRQPAGIMLPKAETAGDIEFLNQSIAEWEKQLGLKMGHIKIIPLVESALGVLNAWRIASASKRVVCLSFGAIDFTLDINTNLSPEGVELAYARSHLVLASKAAGIEAPVDTVYPQVRDLEGLRQEVLRAKQLGMFGKLVIHPAQIPVVNELFTPTEAEIDFAQKVSRAFREAEAQGIGATQVDGKFIDYPVAVRAENILKLAAVIGK